MDINVHVEKVAAKIEQFQNAKLFLVMTSAFQRFIMPHLSKQCYCTQNYILGMSFLPYKNGFMNLVQQDQEVVSK